MNIFKNISKALFGQQDAGPEIVDGKIIADEPHNQDLHAVTEADGDGNESPSTYDKAHVCPTTRPENGRYGRPQKKENFFTYLEAAGRQKRTLQEYRYELRWWERVASDNKRTLNTISAKAIEAAVASLDPRTRSRKLAALKSYARWLLREGHPRLRMETEKLLPPKLPRGLPRDLGAAKFWKRGNGRGS